LATLERSTAPPRSIRTFDQDWDDPQLYREITPGADGDLLFVQADLDRLGDVTILKIVYDD
jgi:hypothetical protein